MQDSRNDINSSLPSDLEKGKLVYESISLASQMINRAKENHEFANYVLVVFSDMDEWRLDKPDDLEIELAKVEVAVIVHTCKYAIDCKPLISRWTNEFEGFGVVKPKVIVQEDNIQKTFERFILELP